MRCPSDCVYIERCPSKVVLADPIEASLCVWRGHNPFDVVWQEVIYPRYLWRMLAILINSNQRSCVVKVEELIGSSCPCPSKI
jgi:hypothetical protein